MTRKQLTEVEAGSEEPLHVKYRPNSLKRMHGNDKLVSSLDKLLAQPNRPHSFLFIGPSGCGKTTLARIVAARVGAAEGNVIEADAATNSGVDAVRAITDTLHFGDQPTKAVIMDEAHALSKQAWQSMLKIVEEPPSHVYFMLCTTDAGKVPDTIKTRCATYTVQELSNDEMLDFLEEVVELEGIKLNSPGVLDMVAKRAHGSPRMALVALSVVAGARDAKEAAILLEQPFEVEEVIELCRALVTARLRWEDVVSTLAQMKDTDAEGIRLTVVNFVQAVLLKSSSKTAPFLLQCLEPFMKPMVNRSEKLAPLLMAFADCCKFK
jgi:replication-associated recombination protein RarA